MSKFLVLDNLPGHFGVITDRFPAVVLKRFSPAESPGYWVPILNKVSVPKVLGENNLLGNLEITPYNLD